VRMDMGLVLTAGTSLVGFVMFPIFVEAGRQHAVNVSTMGRKAELFALRIVTKKAKGTRSTLGIEHVHGSIVSVNDRETGVGKDTAICIIFGRTARCCCANSSTLLAARVYFGGNTPNGASLAIILTAAIPFAGPWGINFGRRTAAATTAALGSSYFFSNLCIWGRCTTSCGTAFVVIVAA